MAYENKIRQIKKILREVQKGDKTDGITPDYRFALFLIGQIAFEE